MFDRILKYFGVIRIERARFITNKVLDKYTEAISEHAKEDFGVEPVKRDNSDFSNACFNCYLQNPDVNIQLRYSEGNTPCRKIK